MTKLLWLGSGLLTIGIIAGFLMPRTGGSHAHFAAAIAVWVAYAVLIALKQIRGLTGRRLSLATVTLFILSLGVFAFI